ncbi:MAG: TonB-dependent receptor [Thermaurantimonas sp.]|uniref:TonB-dependent receptor n=1 Tax=Thermaurantimonas sp. TaxID=2681568 RepID=UPI003919987B
MVKALRYFFVCILSVWSVSAYAQNKLQIRVLNLLNNPIPDAAVAIDGKVEGTTDQTGYFEWTTNRFSALLTVSHIGYQPYVKRIIFKPGEVQKITIRLNEIAENIGDVTITATRLRKPITREVVQVDVLPKELINNINSTRLYDAVDKVPGVTVIDGQMSIRNGSGFAYGVGSRVLVITDGMPILTGDRGDMRWNFAPIEMVENIEVVKGPASVLYGAGGLNGALHIKTLWPDRGKSVARLQTFYNLVDNPRDPVKRWWWKRRPGEWGISASVGESVGNIDYVIGVNQLTTHGYIRFTDQTQSRVTLKSRYRQRSDGKGFSFIWNSSIMGSDEADFLAWADADSNFYVPLNGTSPTATMADGATRIVRQQWHMTPEVLYESKSGIRHRLAIRWYRLQFKNYRDNLKTNLYNADYSVDFPLSAFTKITAGANYQYFDVFDIYNIGNRQGNNASTFVQVDYLKNRWAANAGMRYEYFSISGIESRRIPVFRIGGNYAINPTLFARANFGQGFRFPTFTEIFISTAGNEAVPIFPNLNLRPEYGWNAEIGIKKQLNINKWKNYFDASLFWLDYKDLIEITFGLYLPPRWDTVPPNQVPLDTIVKYLGFQAQNVAFARNAGVEFSWVSEGNLTKDLGLRTLVGYTYSLPVDVNLDTTLHNPFRYIGRFVESVFSKENPVLDAMLKYRNRQLIKVDVEAMWKGWMVGIDYRYLSKVERIDEVFRIFLPGYNDQINKPGYTGNEYFINLRLGYKTKGFGQFTFIVNNLTNREYMVRFVRPEAPRNFTLQYRLEF